MTARRYAVEFRPAALRQLRKLPRDALRRIQADDVLVVTVVRVGHRRAVYRR